MNPYREQVISAIQASVFYSPTTYSWFGKLRPELPRHVKRSLNSQSSRNYLLYNLQSQLYTDFYCQGFAVPSKQETFDFPSMGMTPFVQELANANSGSGYWEDGWEVRATEDGNVQVSKGGLGVHVKPEDCRVPEGTAIATGLKLSLRFPKEFLGISPGFYMALSDEPPAEDDSKNLVRFYWNLTPEGAVRFMQTATTKFNHARLPFKLKVLNDPTRFTRCDAVVLYVHKSKYDAVSAILEEIYPEVLTNLQQGTPAFTKKLAEGVGFAEDPGQGESFGLHRCRILAEGMIRASEQGKRSVEERLRIVEEHFVEQKIDLEKPFLNPASHDGYDVPQSFRKPSRSLVEVMSPQTEFDAKAFLGTAVEIGQRLSQDALWQGDRCNWLGSVPGRTTLLYAAPSVTYSALGPELYAGTSGVAIFLAELYAATGDAEVRRTALGAIRQSLSRVGAIPAPARLGLYSGGLGIALAAVRVGQALRDEELLESSAQLLRRATRHFRDAQEFDLLSGNAGAIVALLALKDFFDDRALLDFAVQLGDRLLKTARASKAGYSWKSSGFPTLRNLTGFSHGTAGVGYALLELFHSTGAAKYRDAAEQAFNYERHWFDADAGNWPDFRTEPGSRRGHGAAQTFATSWCHGAPGIALSRLRAYEILEDETCKGEALVALRTTRRMVELNLKSRIGNFSLCHGLAGNADVLLQGYMMLGGGMSEEYKLVLEVAYAGIKKYAAQGHAWPCGTGSGQSPSLMLGMAGIGYFYLRLQNPEIRSILMPQHEKLRSRITV